MRSDLPSVAVKPVELENGSSSFVDWIEFDLKLVPALDVKGCVGPNLVSKVEFNLDADCVAFNVDKFCVVFESEGIVTCERHIFSVVLHNADSEFSHDEYENDTSLSDVNEMQVTF